MTTNTAAFAAGVILATTGITWWATRPYTPRILPEWR